MRKISMLEFRLRAEAVLEKVRRGQRFVLTYRGQPVARLEPVAANDIAADDPIYRLNELASDTAEPVENGEIDQIVYGA